MRRSAHRCVDYLYSLHRKKVYTCGKTKYSKPGARRKVGGATHPPLKNWISQATYWDMISEFWSSFLNHSKTPHGCLPILKCLSDLEYMSSRKSPATYQYMVTIFKAFDIFKWDLLPIVKQTNVAMKKGPQVPLTYTLPKKKCNI